MKPSIWHARLDDLLVFQMACFCPFSFCAPLTSLRWPDVPKHVFSSCSASFFPPSETQLWSRGSSQTAGGEITPRLPLSFCRERSQERAGGLWVLKQRQRSPNPGGLTPLYLFNETVSVTGLQASGCKGCSFPETGWINTAEHLWTNTSTTFVYPPGKRCLGASGILRPEPHTLRGHATRQHRLGVM